MELFLKANVKTGSILDQIDKAEKAMKNAEFEISVLRRELTRLHAAEIEREDTSEVVD